MLLKMDQYPFLQLSSLRRVNHGQIVPGNAKNLVLSVMSLLVLIQKHTRIVERDRIKLEQRQGDACLGIYRSDNLKVMILVREREFVEPVRQSRSVIELSQGHQNPMTIAENVPAPGVTVPEVALVARTATILLAATRPS